ncbi:MAG: hypothetical protein CFE45_00340 [Burkholderiales bacterium PBB5]|nr:MAG: hypothetical protein CFE45_00340 [Burkholderiales bacterium PBB5]
MDIATFLKVASVVSAFAFGAAVVYRLGGAGRRSASAPTKHARPGARPAITTPRPPAQIPVRSFDGIVEATNTKALAVSIERRTRLSQAAFQRDCQPVLESLAEFIQMLPASESHHHAHPGGLWQHMLEVADIALTYRAGLELPPGADTEERKRLEHRWSAAVFTAALLHDVGKPVTDVKVTIYSDDPRSGRSWTPLAGPMRTHGAHWYTVAFADPSQRDYEAHAKLGAMLLHSFVPARTIRWLAEESDVLTRLLAYLSGDDKDGPLASIIKRADSESVRKNLLQGPRTRFATARARPLIERLMEALRRMLVEGASLPLNRPGAAGWVHDGKVWFVCARLADEVRNYLAQHESLQGVPGKDKNDRLFDTWQEYGAAETAPDGGAVWRVRVECDGWSPPDAFTVLCFSLDKLYEPGQAPADMKGRVLPVAGAPAAAAPVAPNVRPLAQPAPSSVATIPERREPHLLPQAITAPAPVEPTLAGLGRPSEPGTEASAPINSGMQWLQAPGLPVPAPGPDLLVQPDDVSSQEPVASPGPAIVLPPAAEAPPLSPPPIAPEHLSSATVLRPDSASHSAAPVAHVGDTLSLAESARLVADNERPTTTPELGKPLRPREKGQRPAGAAVVAGRTPSPAATAFMAWVAQAVGSGALKYNEDGSLVHFIPEGALLLSPEIFRRFLSEHEAVADGPIAALRQFHGDRAFARLQNELAKSGWTVRNGDENMHYYAFTKADKSLSRTASFCLIGKPELFWNPVPAPNERITRAPRPKRMTLPAGVVAGGRGDATRSPA